MAADISFIESQFDLRGVVLEALPYGSGHINDTYRMRVSQGGRIIDYILQRINHHIFPNVAALMDNIERVTNHIRRKLTAAAPQTDCSRNVLTIVPTRNGASYAKDADGSYWRLYVFVADTTSIDFVSEPKQAYEAAHTFGQFQKNLTDLPGPALSEAIPDFHNTPKRFQTFLNALHADAWNRAAAAKPEIDFVLSWQDKLSAVTDGLAAGTIPTRVTHNDTKINNILLDSALGKGLCVIDLDTVMPGSILYDFGDEARTSTATAAEDEQDLSKVQFRMDLFSELAHGYLDAVREMLTAEELRLLPFSGPLMTFEVGLRFLTDFLDGDHYFKIHRENHNLDRCRTQFELVRQMMAAQDKMQTIVEKYAK